jgi:HlyD family secretion protein
MRLAIAGIVLTAGAAFAGWTYFSKGSRAEAPARQPSAAKTRTIQGVGYVEPRSEVRRLFCRTSGVVKRCRVGAGESAKAGDILLEMDDSTLRAEVELARRQHELVVADAANVKAGVNPQRILAMEQTVRRLQEKSRYQKAEAERLRILRASRSVSEEEAAGAQTRSRQAEAELGEAEAELEHQRKFVTVENRALLEAKVRHAEAQLRLAEERLAESQVRAPFDGTVLKIFKQPGEGVSQFVPEPVLLFGDTSRLRVRAEIDERFVRLLRPGQEVAVFGGNLGGREFLGRVVSVENVMGGKTVFSRAASERIDLDVVQCLIELGEDFRAPIGLQVDVRITVANER